MTETGQKLWDFLTRIDITARMEAATDFNKPAAEAISGLLLEEFGDKVRGQHRIKQMIGHMIKQIMVSRGYELETHNVKVLQDKRVFKKASRYMDGTARTTKKGYVNRNNQCNLGHTNFEGTDHNALAYHLVCLECDHDYWANGTDIFQRKCPNCQSGKPGINI